MRRHMALCVLSVSVLFELGCQRAPETQPEFSQCALSIRRLAAVVELPALPPLPPVVFPAAYPGTPLAGRMGGLAISEPRTHGNLTLYPVFASRPDYPRRIQTLEAAHQSGGLKITDGRAGTVATIALEKTTGDEVLILNGDMLVGGSQDRLTKADQLLPRRTGRFKLDAYCMEVGRMAGKSKHFKAASVISPHRIRRMGLTGEQQAALWKRIAKKAAQVKASTRTHSLAAVYRTKRYHRLAGPYLQAFRMFTRRHPDAIGVAAVINGAVVSVDVFANRNLFADSFAKLLRSFVLDATDPGFVAHGVAEPQLMSWLAELRGAKYEDNGTDKGGRSYRIKAGRGVGTVLIAHEDLIHLVLLSTPKKPAPKPSKSAA